MPRTKMPARKPSKRRRADEVLIKATFINERAENFYRSSIVMKKCIPEKGIELDHTSIFRQIQRRNWSTFVAKPEAAVVPVVREFYANAKEQYLLDKKALRSLVRGQIVQFDSTTINEFYELEDLEEDEYSEWLEGEINGDEVLQMIGIPDGKWAMNNDTIRRLYRSQMTTVTKAWHYFICGKLIPTIHHSDATKDRAFLNYAIQKGLSINVGKVIEQSIISQVKSKVTGGLGHPSLIYELCRRAGVVASPSEEVCHPSLTITHKMLDTFQSQPPAAAAPEAEADEAGPSSRPTRRPGRPPSQTSSSAVEKLETKFKKMKHIVQLLCEQVLETRKELQKEQRKLRARQDQAFQENRQQFAYMTESMQTLATLLQGNSSQAGTSSLLPSPPHFSVYPPPTPPESSEEEEEEDDEDDEEDSPEE